MRYQRDARQGDGNKLAAFAHAKENRPCAGDMQRFPGSRGGAESRIRDFPNPGHRLGVFPCTDATIIFGGQCTEAIA